MDENQDITLLSDEEIQAERVKTYSGSPKDMGLIAELNRRQNDRLTTLIDRFTSSSDKFSNQLAKLTWVLVVLTVFLLVLTAYLAWVG